MTPFSEWTGRLEVAAQAASPSSRVVVLEEADSTQDAAIRLGLVPGDLVTAWRQTNGRGRMGRAWLSGGEAGVAVTIVASASSHFPLSVTAGVAVANAIQSHLGARVGIKWPNDLIVSGRKIAGILVEQDARVARIGIGVNVAQEAWPPELESTAISLFQAGCAVDRVEVIASIAASWFETVRLPALSIEGAFRSRDVLTGSNATIVWNGVCHHGRVFRIDPTGLFILQTEGRTLQFPAEQVSILAANGPALTR